MNRPFKKPSLGILLALLCPLGARAARLSVVVDGAKSGAQKIVEALQRDLAAGNDIQVFDIRTVNFSNPVAKGRFLSRVAAADLVIPVGDPAARLVSTELEDLKTFFIAGATLSGDYLRQGEVTGILSYSPEETVRLAKALLPKMKAIGVLYTPGYEEVVNRMDASARETGVAFHAYRVESRPDIGPVVRKAAGRDDLIWVVGDPLLSQDLIYAYLLRESLIMKKPLASPLPALVGKGALFCTVPDDAKMAALASAVLSRMLSPQPPVEARRFSSAPAGGWVVVNRGLAENLAIRIPPSFRLWEGNIAP